MTDCDIYDVCIIGSGPAGHSSALYTSRSMLKTVLFEGNEPGGQLTKTTTVENYLGYPEGIQGYDLCLKFRDHSEKWGTNIVSEYVNKISKNRDIVPLGLKNNENMYNVYFDDEKYIVTKTIIIATGSSARHLTFDGSEEFWNKGITGCAVCHGALSIFRNKPLFVVGGGDVAMSDALYLSNYTSQVYIVHRRNSFRASKIMQDRVFDNTKIKIIWNSDIVKASGEEFLEKILVKNNKSGEEKEYSAGGLFYAIGSDPSTSFLKDSGIVMDEEGYILTERDSTKTSMLGIFACGDVLSNNKKFKQAIVSAGSGCIAALEAIEYLQ